MKRIALLVPKGDVMPNAVIGAYFLLTQANYFLMLQGREPIFEIKILGYKKHMLLYDGSFSVKTDSFKKAEQVFDLILVPGFTCEMEEPIRLNRKMIEWMKIQHLQHGSELASMCTGGFLLASTGLLRGKACTLHWAFESSFRKMFPDVDFQSDSITTDDNGIYTSGGAYSSLNLILYLIEKFGSKDIALMVSRFFQLDHNRKSQKPFVIFNQQKVHADLEIQQSQEYIEKHFSKPITVSDLAGSFSISRRNFIRRFKSATGNTPSEYIQRVRIEAAKRLIESSSIRMGELGPQTGYRDDKSFRIIFKKHTGFSPSEYKRRFGRV
ncbi:MAG: helix-turn-helix domain-containing protein [Saprospiraceae bacterium]|nr:helix-turn-helix domain-containing protein [Saprospiraceae bacterium]